jgi:hypothetical protein
MLQDPQRFIEIANRLGEASFEYSVAGFVRFTMLAQEIAGLPVGNSEYGEVFRSANQSLTFVRTLAQNGAGSAVAANDLGVLVVTVGNKIASFRDVLGQVFLSQQNLP